MSTSSIEKTVIYKVDGQPLHVHEDGPADAPLALLIHGWSSSWYALSPLFEDLRTRFHVVSVDLPGYGESPRLPERTTIPAYADLLAKFARMLTDRPITVIGHSMGGMITILERVGILNFIVGALEPHFFAITDSLMRPASFANKTTISDEEYKRLRFDARRPGQGRVRAECYWAMRANDLRGKLSGLKDLPTLMIWGMEDNTVPLRDASAVALEWSEADLRIIPNAGHWPQFEAMPETKRYVKAFLGTPVKLFSALDFSDEE
jgi:pimeloyl-ACP methyl ester carboxylesterase